MEPFYMDKNKQNNQTQWSTTNFYLAAFLSAKGLQLVDIDRSEVTRCKFVFNDNDQRQFFVDAFNFGQETDSLVQVDARKLVFAIKSLKQNLHGG